MSNGVQRTSNGVLRRRWTFVVRRWTFVGAVASHMTPSVCAHVMLPYGGMHLTGVAVFVPHHIQMGPGIVHCAQGGWGTRCNYELCNDVPLCEIGH